MVNDKRAELEFGVPLLHRKTLSYLSSLHNSPLRGGILPPAVVRRALRSQRQTRQRLFDSSIKSEYFFVFSHSIKSHTSEKPAWRIFEILGKIPYVGLFEFKQYFLISHL
jgi:hypothetical protein